MLWEASWKTFHWFATWTCRLQCTDFWKHTVMHTSHISVTTSTFYMFMCCLSTTHNLLLYWGPEVVVPTGNWRIYSNPFRCSCPCHWNGPCRTLPPPVDMKTTARLLHISTFPTFTDLNIISLHVVRRWMRTFSRRSNQCVLEHV